MFHRVVIREPFGRSTARVPAKEVVMTKNMKWTLAGLIFSAIAGLGVSATTAQAQDGLRCVAAQSTDRFYVWEPAGWHAIAIQGSGVTDLDFVVRVNGVVVHEDRDSTDYTYGTW